MSRVPSKSGQLPQDPRAISHWTRVYARNRSLGVLVFLAIFLLLSVAIGGSSLLAGLAFRSGHLLLFGICLALLAAALVALVYCSLPSGGGRLQEAVVRSLYAKEGNVAFVPACRRAKIWGLALGACFGSCVIASVMFDFVWGIPAGYRQPLSALYVVPFLVGVWWLMRPMAGYAALLWPLLYALHALLIICGAPILFSSPWDGLNLLIPIAGYGMVSALVSHVCSRVALGRLKRLARSDLPAGEASEEVDG